MEKRKRAAQARRAATYSAQTHYGQLAAKMNDLLAQVQAQRNGTGCPKGISGGDIPLEARITAMSDSFDAATARQTHRESNPPFAILAELRENADGSLDPVTAETAALGLAQMPVGRFVVLSNRSVGKVAKVLADSIAYPSVVVVGRRIQTGPELYPVSLSGQMPLF